MIRVGFILTFDAAGWLGGISYFRNLLGALMVLPNRVLEPVILAGEKTDPGVLANFPRVEVIRSRLLDDGGVPFLLRRISAKILHRDLGLESILRRHHIQALSHQGFFGSLGRIPLVGWIPDFQDRHLPSFFSASELRARARKRKLMCRSCSRVLLSSHDAQNDLRVIDPQCAARSRVLQFVADVAPSAESDSGSVAGRLGVTGPYFHLPNQFWVHKNHRTVVQALALLKSRGVKAVVIATGNKADHRQPEQFRKLMELVEDSGLGDRFLSVGVLPHSEVIALMAGAAAVINPSLFEGWSTTVEEAKSLGKEVLLSDLRVHREQAPSRARYFVPDDVTGLADLMQDVLVSYNPAGEVQAMQSLQAQLAARRQTFAERYQEIVVELVRG